MNPDLIDCDALCIIVLDYLLTNSVFLISGHGIHTFLIEASADLHPGRHADAAEGSALHQAADGVQCRLEHVQALHQGKA